MSGLHSGIPVSTIGTGVWVRWGPYEQPIGAPVSTIGTGVWVRWGPYEQPIGAPVSTIGEGVWARWAPSSRSGWHIGSLRFGSTGPGW